MRKDLGLKRGYIAEACRNVGVSRTVYDTARKKLGNGELLTQAEIRVMTEYNRLVKEAKEQFESLKKNVV